MNDEKLDYFGCNKNYSCDNCECYVKEDDFIKSDTFLCCKYCFNCIVCCEDCIKNR